MASARVPRPRDEAQPYRLSVLVYRRSGCDLSQPRANTTSPTPDTPQKYASTVYGARITVYGPSVNRRIRLRRLEGQIGEVAYQFTRLHFSGFRENEYLWRPAVNIFLCSSCLRICVELAGVDSEETKIHVSPGWLSISGSRTAPEPPCGDEEEISASHKAVRVMAMEISYGNFERSIEIPLGYDFDRIHTEWENGLLWIFLPRRAHA